ncbi:MAG: DUF4097 family beta strand repeat-containing protein [Gemmatimonadales bacterium]
MRLTSLVLLALPLAVAAPLAAQDFRWHAALASGKTLEIRGISGRIHATRTSGTEAEVTATKRADRGDPRVVEIKMEEDADGVTICAMYPSRRTAQPRTCEEGTRGDMKENDTEVAFEVRVPAGVRFVGTNVNGDVEGEDLPGDAILSTVNGDIAVSGAGTARATTVNGSIKARMGRADWTGTLRLTTVNGGIKVTLPAEAAFTVEASTVNGSVGSEFPITVQGRMKPNALRGTVGGGGRALDLTTVNGSIDLVKGS